MACSRIAAGRDASIEATRTANRRCCRYCSRRCAILRLKQFDLRVPPLARSKAFQELFLPARGRKQRAGSPTQPEDNPAFQEIWAVVGAIPRGSVSTYGAVARAAGLPGRARMAGRALRESPKEMKLPWHRVVGAGGKIVFPLTSLNHREQARRLRAEGVVVKDGRVSREAMRDL
jgi:methylated-DNA-protein-cysteine methyltransferase-like protein